MTNLDILRQRRAEILAAAARRGTRNLRAFGSSASGEADPESDIDLLLEFEPGRSLFDQGSLLIDLECLLRRSVDVVTVAGLKARLRERVLQEAQSV